MYLIHVKIFIQSRGPITKEVTNCVKAWPNDPEVLFSDHGKLWPQYLDV